MGLKDIQKAVDDWTGQFTPQYWPPHEMLARLAEETGETAREINHLHGTKKKKLAEETQGLGSELADVLFTICCIANYHNLDLQKEWERMMQEKMYGRDKNRFEKKD